MTLTDVLGLAWPFGAGLALGALYFGGLWYTVRRGTRSARPALWFGISFLVRMGVLLAGLLLVGDGQWTRIMVALLGVIGARYVLLRTLPKDLREDPPRANADGHAA